MIRKLIRFELQYQFRQPIFWGICLVFFLLGFLLGFRGFAGPGNLVNSPYQIIYTQLILSLGISFSVMFQAVTGVLRDIRYGFDSILFSTPLRKEAYFISRFTGVFLAGVSVMTISMLGFSLGASMLGVESEKVHTFEMLTYLQTWLWVVLPNVWITSSVIFSVAVLSRNALMVYVSAILMYALYWICAIFLNSPMMAHAVPASPENLAIAALADPFGISAFFEQTQFWTPFQKNHQMVEMAGYFLGNRMIWISLSAAGLAVTFLRFFPGMKKEGSRHHRNENENRNEYENKDSSTVHWENKYMDSQGYKRMLTQTVGMRFHFLTWLSLWKYDMRFVLKGLPFLGAMLMWIVIVVSEIGFFVYGGGDYGQSSLPTTGLLISLIKDPFPFLAILLIVFYGGELTGRERSLNFHWIIDATPVSNLMIFLSKLISLISIPFMLIFSSIIIGIFFQLIGGYDQLDLDVWMSMFYFQGIPLIFYAFISMFFQSVTQHKYLGMLLTGLCILIGTGPFLSMVGVEHPMLHIGKFPEVIYTEMTGFGAYSIPFLHFVVYWLSLGVLLVLMGCVYFPRGNNNNISSGFRLLFHGKNPRLTIFFIGGAFIFLGTAWKMNTHFQPETVFLSSKKILDRKEMYERKYKQYQEVPRLHRVAIKTHVDLFLKERKYNIRAEYKLKNKNEVPVYQILISERVPIKSVFLERAKKIEYDSLLSIWRYEFFSPVLPGEEIKFLYEMEVQYDLFDTDRMLVNNGSYLMHAYFEPILSYASSREIADAYIRKKRGLEPRFEEVNHEDHIHLEDPGIGKVPFETIVSTSSDQIAIAPGNLIRQWQENERTFFHYKSPVPIVPILAYASGKYEIREEMFRGIKIIQYYHPSHAENIESIFQYAKESLGYCIDKFGPYPFDHLRIFELPGHWNFGGQCLPGSISMVEHKLYTLDTHPHEFDLVAKRTIHEVSHQWWGHILASKNVPGGNLYTEGLAKYTEAVVMEKLFGKAPLVQLSKSANQRYFSGRSFATETEPPVYLSDGEGYLSYGKMYTVMLSLKELLGEKLINDILADLVAQHRNDTEMEIVSTEFLQAIYTSTPDSLHTLIDDWFKRKITYDLKISNASFSPIPNGKYKIELEIEASRNETQEDGSILPIGIDEPLQIGVFEKRPENIWDATEVIDLQFYPICASHTRLTLIVDRKPTYVAIDPYGSRSVADTQDCLRSLNNPKHN